MKGGATIGTTRAALSADQLTKNRAYGTSQRGGGEGGISDTHLYFSFSERPLGRKLISPKIMTFFCWVVLLPICHFPSWWKGTFFITRKFFHCVVALPTGLFLAWKIGQDVMMLFLYSQYTNCHKTSESLLSSLSQGILDHSFYDYLHNSIIIFVALLSNCEKKY